MACGSGYSMRVISGKYKGIRLPDKGLVIARPTTDRAKESLFNILALRYDFETLSVLDLYAGSGGIGLEFVSRGCGDVTLVEQHRGNIKYIQSAFSKLGAQGEIIQSKSLKFLESTKKRYDIIFADPPYASKEYEDILKIVRSRSLLKEGACLIFEHDSKAGAFQIAPDEQRVYGQSTFSFFTFDQES